VAVQLPQVAVLLLHPGFVVGQSAGESQSPHRSSWVLQPASGARQLAGLRHMHVKVPPSPLSHRVPVVLLAQSEALTQPRQAPVAGSQTPPDTAHPPSTVVQLRVHPFGGLHTMPLEQVALFPTVQTHDPVDPPSSAQTRPRGFAMHSVLLVQAPHRPPSGRQTSPSAAQFGPPSWTHEGRHSPPRLAPSRGLHIVPLGHAPASLMHPQPRSMAASRVLPRFT